MNGQGKNTLRGWLELIRFPNIFTVPGDVLAGYVITWPLRTGGWSDLFAAMLAVIFLYLAGLIINDLVDVQRDRQERPDRPLPSGRVRVNSARMLAAGFMTAALVLLASRTMDMLFSGIVLGCLIFIYNMWARCSRWTGAIIMGLCRAASVGMGVVSASVDGLTEFLSVGVMIWWAIYIGSVSWLAAREVEEGAYGRERWWPLLIIAVGGTIIMYLSGSDNGQSTARSVMAFAFAGLIAWQSGIRLQMKAPHYHAPVMGWLISALIPMQAGMVVLFGREPWMLLAALLILFGWPLHRWLTKSFAAS